MLGFILVVFVLGLAILLGRSILSMSRRSSAVRQHAAMLMRGRVPLTSQQFADAFFPASHRALAKEVREILERTIIVDMKRAHPDDRLLADLGLGQVDGLEVFPLAFDLKRHFGIDVLPLFAKQDPTLRQLVEFVAKQEPPSKNRELST